MIVVLYFRSFINRIMSSSDADLNGAEGKRKVALITGITGQDGSYLAEFLLEKG